MKQGYYLTDLDGTLLRSDATLSPYTLHTVTEALHRGAVISFATARSYASSIRAVGEIPWKYPLVLYNGALLFDPIEFKVLDGHWLDNQITNDIIEYGRIRGILPLVFCLNPDDQEKVLHERLHRVGDVQFLQSRPNDPRFSCIEPLVCADTYRTLIITFIGMLEELQDIHRDILAEYGSKVHSHLMKDQYIPDHYFLEFSHSLANKQEGLRLWSKHVGCEPSEVTVFGDNLNDIGLFKVAGQKLAVRNAHPQIVKMADRLIDSNDQDGVAKYLSE
jgi:Cof subfamily protein (haloacid dehalogenase superfamily)